MASLPPETIWYLEYITPDLVQGSAVRHVLYDGRTAYQRVQVIETRPFGRSLVLDGKTQSSEADEWVYHEGLVQPAMVAHAGPKRVFIAGGGEGATAREVLRHSSVTEVVMVDLDREVVDLCREHLPNHHRGSFDDPRLTLLHEDALAYLERSAAAFDIAVIDVPDPLESGPAYLLYTQEFYRLVASRLSPGGLMVTQSGPVGPTNVTEVFTAIHKTMASMFDRTAPYRVYVPSFGTMWGFIVGGASDAPALAEIEPAEIDQRIAKRISSPLAYYDGLAHRGLFGLPKYVREALAAETRLITKADPIYAI
jgi:spermidine synthase